MGSIDAEGVDSWWIARFGIESLRIKHFGGICNSKLGVGGGGGVAVSWGLEAWGGRKRHGGVVGEGRCAIPLSSEVAEARGGVGVSEGATAVEVSDIGRIDGEPYQGFHGGEHE